jgi:hypothetical protein
LLIVKLTIEIPEKKLLDALKALLVADFSDVQKIFLA